MLLLLLNKNFDHVKEPISPMKNVRAHAIIEGIVQGVCFRAYTQHEAQRLEVSGWVKNRNDGSVEAVFEGDRHAVEALIAWCHAGPPHAHVNKVKVTAEDYTGEFTGFSITY